MDICWWDTEVQKRNVSSELWQRLAQQREGLRAASEESATPASPASLCITLLRRRPSYLLDTQHPAGRPAWPLHCSG